MIRLTVASCGGQPSAPPAAPRTLYLVPAAADATPTTPFQPILDAAGRSGFSAFILGTPPAATDGPDAVIPATITTSGACDRRLTYAGHPRNVVRSGASMALAGLRQMLMETATS